MKNIIIQIILLVAFTALIYISFYIHENGDMNVVIFGTIIYFPCVLTLCFYNGLIIHRLNSLNRRYGLINYVFPVVPILLWYILKSGKIKIINWELDSIEFYIAIATLLIINIIGYYVVDYKSNKMASR